MIRKLNKANPSLSVAALIYVSGSIHHSYLQEAPRLLVTDGSIHQLLQYDISNYLHKLEVIGDFDSLDKGKLPEGIKLVEAPSQDYNDFQKSFQMLGEELFGRIVVFMEAGKRLDHLLANMDFMGKYGKTIQWHFGQRICYIIGEGEYFFDVRPGKNDIGLSSFNECKIKTSGFKQEVDGKVLSSSSNVTKSQELCIRVEQGRLFLSL